MTDEFDLFPLAVVHNDNSALTIEIRKPDLPPQIPPWGNECFWTDPPPDHCFGGLPKEDISVHRLGSEICCHFGSGTNDLNAIFSPAANSGQVGKVVEGTDINTFPPHLIPLIQTINEAASKAGVDLANIDMAGLSIVLHK